MRGQRVIVAVVLSGLGLVAAAAPAAAHAELVASTPAEGAELAAAPRQVQLTFNEPVRLQPDPVTVSGPGGVSWAVGQATVAGAVVTVLVEPAGPAGPYTLTFRVISVDGDPTSGTVRFALTAPVATTTAPTTVTTTVAATPTPTTAGQPPTTTAAQDADNGGGVPAWVWLLVAAAALAAVVAVTLRARGPRSPSE